MANDGIWDLSLPSDELTVEHNALLKGAPYSTLEVFSISLIIAFSTVGIVANVVGFYTLLRNRATWDDEQFFLTGLAIADIIYLVCGLAFFVAPFATSPVSQDVPFHHCWRIIGTILFMQVVSTFLIIGIAAETYWRATRGNYLGAIIGRHAHTIFVVALLPTSLLCIALALPAIFDNDSMPTEIRVKWPNSSTYENFPPTIRICSQERLQHTRLVIFQDLIVFWIGVPLMMFLYGKTIKTINSRQGATGRSGASNLELSTADYSNVAKSEENQPEIQDASTSAEGREGDTSRDIGHERERQASPANILDAVLNLKLRIAIYIVCQVGGRLFNLSMAIKRDVTGEPLLPFLSMESELVLLIVRLFLLLQPTINPFIYFFGRGHMRSLLRKTYKFE